MRNKFADVIFEIGQKNEKICALVADISPAGSMVKFQEQFPERFINTGVAEQSMIGIAAGMALRGMRPFCYTIATFSLYRPFEIIRVDLCYQNLPVTIVGMGAGLIYSTLGSTHHSMEDIAIASALPNMQVMAPCDPDEMRLATEWCANKSQNPTYMRLGKAGEPNLTNKAEKFEFGKIRYLSKGDDFAVISYGVTVKLAFELKKKLENIGNTVSVISCHTIKPLDRRGILDMLNKHKKVIVLEEMIPTGGLSSLVTEISLSNNIVNKLKCFTLKDEFIKFYGSHDELLTKHNLSLDFIINNLSE